MHSTRSRESISGGQHSPIGCLSPPVLSANGQRIHYDYRKDVEKNEVEAVRNAQI